MIECESLTKRFGSQTAVDAATFSCPAGAVTGFIGPNGAGKSTTMRMICGLTPPTAGGATIDGRPYRDLPNPAREAGVLLDASAVHPGRTGRETLAIVAATIGMPRSRVDEMLGYVGLDESAGSKRVGGYSLGMRQRLGIAAALMGSPRVLILDEPANGLDPEGIRWMREALRAFADDGGTVLLSSHLLKEVEAIADRLVVISNGRIVADGTPEELADDPVRPAVTYVQAVDPHALAAALADAGIWWRYAPDGSTFAAEAEPAAIGAAALRGGVVLSELRAAGRAGLEDVFFSLTSSQSSGREGGIP